MDSISVIGSNRESNLAQIQKVKELKREAAQKKLELLKQVQKKKDYARLAKQQESRKREISEDIEGSGLLQTIMKPVSFLSSTESEELINLKTRLSAGLKQQREHEQWSLHKHEEKEKARRTNKFLESTSLKHPEIRMTTFFTEVERAKSLDLARSQSSDQEMETSKPSCISNDELR
jgi:hypothetical protein